MTGENFLSRWSRRKLESEEVAAAPVPAADDAQLAATEGEDAKSEEFDLSILPPIESITAATDVTAFLREGVPLELSRAAFRRVWSADPVIRNFVGLAENAWDFNDPNAMPGFGPLDYSEEQLRELVGKIVGGVRQATIDLPSNVDNQKPGTHSTSSEICPAEETAEAESAADVGAENVNVASIELEVTQCDKQRVALQEIACDTDTDAPVMRHTHGSALPR